MIVFVTIAELELRLSKVCCQNSQQCSLSLHILFVETSKAKSGQIHKAAAASASAGVMIQALLSLKFQAAKDATRSGRRAFQKCNAEQ